MGLITCLNTQCYSPTRKRGKRSRVVIRRSKAKPGPPFSRAQAARAKAAERYEAFVTALGRRLARVAARAKAAERYEAFVTALGRRLARVPKLRQKISEDINPAEDNGMPIPCRIAASCSHQRLAHCAMTANCQSGRRFCLPYLWLRSLNRPGVSRLSPPTILCEPIRREND